MTKLNLQAFLRIEETVDYTPIPNSTPSFTCPVEEVISILTNHTGSFLYENKQYPSVLSSEYSCYFYGGDRSPSLFVYESLIDIKRKENTLLLFSYQEHPIVITLL